MIINLGSSIGPAVAGSYMPTHQEIGKGSSNVRIAGSFPSLAPHDLKFLTVTLTSAVLIILIIILGG